MERVRSEEYPKSPEEHLAALNEPIKKAGLGPLFRIDDLGYSKPGEPPKTSLIETLYVTTIGDNFGIPKIRSRYEADGAIKEGFYTALMYSQDEYESSGGLYITNAKRDEILPNARFDLKEFNLKMERFRIRSISLPQTTHSVGIYDENRDRFIVLTIDSGIYGKIPLVLNKMQEGTGSEGHIFTVRFPDRTYGFVNTFRPLVGHEEIGLLRGYSGVLSPKDRYQPLKDELGVDFDPQKTIVNFKMIQDPRTDAVTDDFYIVKLDSIEFQDRTRQAEAEYQVEKITPERLTKRQILEGLTNGKINDAHSVAGLVTSMISTDELILNEQKEVDKEGVVMERVSLIWEEGRERLVGPRGPIDSGNSRGILVPDSGKTRILYSREQGDVNLLPKSRNYEFRSYRELYHDMLRCDLDIVTVSTFGPELIQNEILVSPD